MLKKSLFVLLLCVPFLAHAWDYDRSWANSTATVYKIVGNRGQDIFRSNICPANSYTLYPDKSNVYTGANFTLSVTDDYSALIVNSKNKCFPSGTYQLLK